MHDTFAIHFGMTVVVFLFDKNMCWQASLEAPWIDAGDGISRALGLMYAFKRKNMRLHEQRNEIDHPEKQAHRKHILKSGETQIPRFDFSSVEAGYKVWSHGANANALIRAVTRTGEVLLVVLCALQIQARGIQGHMWYNTVQMLDIISFII